MELWVVFSRASEEDGYQLQGVFSTQLMAEKACFDEYCVMGPVELDRNYEEEKVEWQGSYKPFVDGFKVLK